MTPHDKTGMNHGRTVVGFAGSDDAGPDPVPQMRPGEVLAAANRAARRIAPLWPLESFVAVNPFVGISNLRFADADNTVQRTWGARLVMPRTFYEEALNTGRVTRAHINRALDELPDEITAHHDVASVVAASQAPEPAGGAMATVAELLGEATGDDWHAFVIDRISTWAAGYFDEGQAGWRSPWRGESPYAAWRGEAELDRTPEILGVPGFCGIVRTLPQDADTLLLQVAHELRLHGEVFETYLGRLLATVAGWAGHARFRGWRKELAGEADARVREVLAIRAAWDLALVEAFGDRYPHLGDSLRQGMTTPLHPDMVEAHRVNLILHTAYEIAGRERLLNSIKADEAEDDIGDSSERPSTQAVFCIDVRSERYRRALEAADPSIETLGFAGFFGFALEVTPADQDAGGAQCPVLLEPQFVVRETEPGADAAQTQTLARRMWLGRRLDGRRDSCLCRNLPEVKKCR